MVSPAESKPTDHEWADARLTVMKHDFKKQPDATVFEFTKTISKNGRTYTQTLWINIHQLRSVAMDHCF